MLARRARRSLPPLLAACLALALAAGLAACDGDADPEEPRPPAPTAPAATPPPTPEATPPPTPTATPSPTPTATATPSPPPTATPTPLITAEDLGIREVDTAEALAAAGLTHVRYAAGEEVPWEAGLFLLDTATGTVEGWVVSEGDSLGEDGRAVGVVHAGVRLSPGNRFLLLPGGTLHDRMTGRTYEGAEVLAQSSYPNDLIGLGSGLDERLVLRSSAQQGYVVVDGEMRAVALLAGAGADVRPHPKGRYLFAYDRRQLKLFDLMHASGDVLTPSFIWPLDWVKWNTSKDITSAWVVPFEGGLAVINAIDSATCRIAHYRVDGQSPADHEYPCWQSYGPFIDISPDGSFLAIARSGFGWSEGLYPKVTDISVFDAISGEEILRNSECRPVQRRCAVLGLLGRGQLRHRRAHIPRHPARHARRPLGIRAGAPRARRSQRIPYGRLRQRSFRTDARSPPLRSIGRGDPRSARHSVPLGQHQ